MIGKLPPEIILKISGHLKFKDKLTLATTCSMLNDLISRASLYEELNLFKNGRKPINIIKLFENDPFDGSQVKILHVKMNQLPDQLRSHLSTVFPSVSKVIVGKQNGYSGSARLLNEEDLTSPMSRWIKTIESYNLYTDWDEIFYCLRFKTFSRLKQLRIGLSYIFMERRMGFDPLYFLPFIKNAPYLTDLTLFECDINFEFLDEVHNSCPYIESLKLDSVAIVVDRAASLHEIGPASTVLTLELYNVVSFDRNGLLLDYIIKKYTRLQHLTLDLYQGSYMVNSKLNTYFPDYSFDTESENESDFEDEDEIAPVVNNELNETISRFQDDYSSGISIYLGSGVKFFSGLPKTMKTLKLDIKSFNSLIEAVCNSGMTKLVELNFADSLIYRNVLKNQNQLKHLQTQSSIRTLGIPINSTIQNYNQNLISTHITRLTMECENGPLYINWILDMFPSLKYLYIKRSKCSLWEHSKESGLAYYQKKYPNLIYFGARKCSFYPRVLGFLKSSAPNITNLNLMTVNFIAGSSDPVYNIDISGTNLEKFHVSFTNSIFSRKIRYYQEFTVQTNSAKLIQAKISDEITLEKTELDAESSENAPIVDDVGNYVNELKVNDS